MSISHSFLPKLADWSTLLVFQREESVTFCYFFRQHYAAVTAHRTSLTSVLPSQVREHPQVTSLQYTFSYHTLRIRFLSLRNWFTSPETALGSKTYVMKSWELPQWLVCDQKLTDSLLRLYLFCCVPTAFYSFKNYPAEMQWNFTQIWNTVLKYCFNRIFIF